jgi:hypothetical protein
MPTVYQFNGIDFKIRPGEQTGKHHQPHIHVEYGGYKASIALDGSVLAGSLPRKQLSDARAVIIRNQAVFFLLWTQYNP